MVQLYLEPTFCLNTVANCEILMLSSPGVMTSITPLALESRTYDFRFPTKQVSKNFCKIQFKTDFSLF